MKATLSLTLLGLAFACASAPITAEAQVQDTQHARHSVTPNVHLDLHNPNGAVEIIAAQGTDAITLTATLTADTQADLDAIKVDIEATHTHVTVKTHLTRQNLRGTKVDYRVTLPETASLTIDVLNGAITSRGVTGDVTLKTLNGSIKATHLSSKTNLTTKNGTITATFDKLDATTKNLETKNGTITITLPPKPTGTFEAKTSLGKVTHALDDATLHTHTRTHLKGAFPGSSGALHATTRLGTVHIDQKR